MWLQRSPSFLRLQLVQSDITSVLSELQLVQSGQHLVHRDLHLVQSEQQCWRALPLYDLICLAM